MYRFLPLLLVLSALAFAQHSTHQSTHKSKAAPPRAPAAPFNTAIGSEPLPGMPAVTDPADIWAAGRAGALSPIVKNFPARIYVPNSSSDTIDVIDPATFKIVDHFAVGHQPQHVVPSWDMKSLWVLNDLGDSVTRIDPATGKKGDTFPVADPYNMYFTPDGKYAMVVAEAQARLDFREPSTMKLVGSVKVPCKGVDHVDFSANGRYLLATCEFSGTIVKVDVAERKLAGLLQLKPGSKPGQCMPQDIKLSPDGKVFYVADMMSDGVFLVDGENMKKIGFLPTGKGAHGLYPSRDSKSLYVSNRGMYAKAGPGSISVIDFATRKVARTWSIPGGGSPDMGGVSADGKVLWLSGRYSAEVYAIDVVDWKLLARIPVGKGPHGLCVYPQPGRYSLGHTGIFR